VTIAPASTAITVGGTATFTATLTRADCSTTNVTQEAVWSTDAPAILRITGLGTVEGVAEGSANVRASVDTTLSAPAVVTVGVPAVQPELRGVWVTRFGYSNQASLERVIDDAAAAGFNAVFVQIRATGDAYYQSSLEPWSARLGALGRNPGWDPLAVALARAHMHGMELHAYFNALSAWTAAGDPPQAEGTVQHALRTHPEWKAVSTNGTNTDTEYAWFTPGNPAVRAHVAAVAEDLLTRYAVDGLHLDRIRSPARTFSHDAVTEAAYSAARALDASLSWDAFMQEQVNQTVGAIHAALMRARPAARLSASVWGIYMPLPGCNTSAGLRDYHQDSRAWLQRGIMDALAPMIYWPMAEGACTDWAALMRGFMDNRHGRHIWAGMHALEPGNTWDFSAIAGRVAYARTQQAAGTMLFASSYLDQGTGAERWELFRSASGMPGPFAEPASTPAMPWKN
jgi:uncharacterized lipoprotein YddW (UPF0748 family)